MRVGAVKGLPAMGVRTALVPIEKPEMLPSVLLPT